MAERRQTQIKVENREVYITLKLNWRFISFDIFFFRLLSILKLQSLYHTEPNDYVFPSHNFSPHWHREEGVRVEHVNFQGIHKVLKRIIIRNKVSQLFLGCFFLFLIWVICVFISMLISSPAAERICSQSGRREVPGSIHGTLVDLAVRCFSWFCLILA